MQHREREGQLLPHAAREPGPEPRTDTRQPGLSQQAGHPFIAFRGGEAVGAGDEGDVLVDAEVAVDACGAGDVPDPAPLRPPHAPPAGDDPGEHAQQGRLAGTSPPITAVTAPRGTSSVTPSSARASRSVP